MADNEPGRILDFRHDSRDTLARAREALAPVQAALEAAGFYAYGTVDTEHRWVISADDEAGHVDVRVGGDGFQVDLWTTSPGLFSEEENEFRRRAMERLARRTLPGIEQGFLDPHQATWWDDAEAGPAARVRYELPFGRAADAGAFVRERMPELERLIAFIETQVAP
ncbi:MAG: hypothetical protein U0Z70_11035 [Thermomicrobiales bacterium]|nr:hypothetical protein [Chloroflexia bacterium]